MSISSQFEALLLTALAERRSAALEEMALGYSIQSYEAYRQAVGFLSALDVVRDDLIPAVNQTLNEG